MYKKIFYYLFLLFLAAYISYGKTTFAATCGLGSLTWSCTKWKDPCPKIANEAYCSSTGTTTTTSPCSDSIPGYIGHCISQKPQDSNCYNPDPQTCILTNPNCSSSITSFSYVSCTAGGGGGSTPTVTFTMAPHGPGYVTSTNPLGLDCGSTGNHNRCSIDVPQGSAGDDFRLVAHPDNGSGYFAEWTGGGGTCGGTSNVTCDPLTDRDRDMEATFRYKLTVVVNGPGRVVNDNNSIDCPGDCVAPVTWHARAELTIPTAYRSDWKSWNGMGCESQGLPTCTETSMDDDRTVTVYFSSPVTLTVRKVDQNGNRITGGTISSSPGGISCGSDCEGSYDEGDTVTLSRTSDPSGYTFKDWSGAGCLGTGNSCTTSGLDRDKEVTATYNEIKNYTLTVSTSGSGTGTVSGTGISCGSDCTETYPDGTSVTLTANAGSGSIFTGWSGACSGTGNCSLTMNANKSVTATFNSSPVVCTPSTQNVDVNQSAGLTGSGGTGSYSWSAPGGNPTSGNGQTFSTKYATPGTKTVSVSSGTSKSCTVNVGCPTTKPSGLSPSGTISAGTRNITWNAVSGVTGYALRVDDQSNGWKNNCDVTQYSGDVCKDNQSTTSYSYNFQEGHDYQIWVHAIYSCGWSEATLVNVSVPAQATPTPASTLTNLTVESIQTFDAQGNPKTNFNNGETVKTKVIIKNNSAVTAGSTTRGGPSVVYSLYSNQSSQPSNPSSGEISQISCGVLAPQQECTSDVGSFTAQTGCSNCTVGAFAGAYVDPGKLIPETNDGSVGATNGENFRSIQYVVTSSAQALTLTCRAIGNDSLKFEWTPNVPVFLQVNTPTYRRRNNNTFAQANTFNGWDDGSPLIINRLPENTTYWAQASATGGNPWTEPISCITGELTPTPTQTPTPTPTQGPDQPWKKLKGSSFGGLSALDNVIPQLVTKYDSDDTTDRYFIIGEAGVVSANGAIDLGTGQVSSNNWKKTGYSPSPLLTADTFIDYIKSRKDYETPSGINGATANKINIFSGNGTLNNSGVKDNTVLIVEGNVTINETKFNQANPNPKSFAVLATGKITFGDGVEETNGIFIANAVDTGTNTNKGLKITGNLVSKTPLTHNRQWNSNTRPSLFVVVDPKQYLDLLPLLSTATYDWKQLQ